MMTLQNQTPQIIIQIQPPKTLGILGIIFGFLSIFVLAFLFVPLALLFSILALFKKDLTNKMLASFGIIFSVMGLLTSPFLLGVIGMSQLLR